jgi:hypothetical protein
MKRRDTAAPLAGMISIFGLGLLVAIPGIGECAEEGPMVAFRAKVSVLPSEASVVHGKAPDEIVEIVLPGRVYGTPIKVVPVKARRDANRKTPEQASASDFSAFREADPEWLRENFVEEDYPTIKRMVEDRNMRRLNQSTYMNYGEKTIISRCTYKDFALLFVRYDGVAGKGVVEVYRKTKGDWKRTHALSKDETVVVLQAMFRQGSFEEIVH